MKGKPKNYFWAWVTPGRRFAAFYIVLALFLAACAQARANTPESKLDQVMERRIIRAGVRFDNPPHSFINEEGQWVGFDNDIAQAVARQLGVELELVRVD